MTNRSASGFLLNGVTAFAAEESSIRKAISAWAKQPAPPAYRYALVGLNDDGIDDAVVLLTDKAYCGSGGCTMIILQGKPGAFQVVSSSTVTHQPILVLPEKHNGW